MPENELWRVICSILVRVKSSVHNRNRPDDIYTIYISISLQYAAACNVTSEDGTVVKERECLGRCGTRGHQISHDGENLMAYFCRPRGSRRDDDSDIDGVREHFEDFMIDLHDLWDSEFGDDWWSNGGDDDDDDDEDWWEFGDDDDDNDNWGSFGDDDDDSWWPFGDHDDGNDWWPSGGDDDDSWWDFEGSGGRPPAGRPEHPGPGDRPTGKPDSGRPTNKPVTPEPWTPNCDLCICSVAVNV